MFSPFQQTVLKAMGYTLYTQRDKQITQSAAQNNDVTSAATLSSANSPAWISKLSRFFSEQQIQLLPIHSLSPNATKAKREAWQQLRKVLRAS